MHPTLKSNKGFTLVELMLVVAIVGVLSAIGMAQYEHFVAKARQAEAKVALSAIYTSESAFFAENNAYTACLRQIGYVPEGTVRYYLVGFSYSAANDSSNPCGPNGNQPCSYYNFTSGSGCNAADPNHLGFPAPLTNSDSAYSASVFVDNGAYYKAPLVWHLDSTANGIPTVITSTSFLAGAAGAISYRPSGHSLPGEPNNINTPHCCDGWSIDQNKNLVNMFPGI